MNRIRQNEIFNSLFERASQIMMNKGDDYANQLDRLSNFKVAGNIALQNIPNAAKLNCLNLIATKVARLGQLYSSGNIPANELLEDTIIDLFNYAALLYMLEKEE